MYKSLNESEIRPDATTGFHGNKQGYSGKNGVITFSRMFLIGFILYLQVMIHTSLNEFKIRRDPTMDYGVGCPLASEKRLIMGKMTSSHFLSYFSSDPFHTCRQ